MAVHLRHPNAGLRVCYWNADGIDRQKAEFHAFLTDNHIDVALINETHLNDFQPLNLANYATYRNDRPTAGGGTAVLVKRRLQHHVVPTPPLRSLEATGISINTRAGPITMFAVYLAPRCRLHQTDIDSLLQGNVPIMICGDLNSKHPSWNSRVQNTRGLQLLRHTNNSSYVVRAPPQPTYYSYNPAILPDTLDIAVLNNIIADINLNAIPALNSDHDPVIMDFTSSPVTPHRPPGIRLQDVDWDRFRVGLTQLPQPPTPISDATDLDAAVTQLTANIFLAARSAATKSKPPPTPYYELPATIKALIAAKNATRKIWQRRRDPTHKAIYNSLVTRVRTAVAAHRNEQWEAKLRSLSAADTSIWKMTKAILNKPTSVPAPPLRSRTGLAHSDTEKSEALADAMASQLRPHDDVMDADHAENVISTVKDFLQENQPPDFEPVTEDEVKTVLHSLPRNKAPGPDRIPNEVLSHLPQPQITFLTNIFNHILLFNHFPTSWKTAKIVTFPKPGKDHSIPSNYRPISLLNTLSKAFERIILSRLQSHISSENILREEQFGFRASHSTTHQLLRVAEKVTKNFNHKRYTGLVFLDLAQAFDRVWHTGLLFKLINLHFPASYIKLLSSYLFYRSFTVGYKSAESSRRPILAGVPQGSLIGPVLFNLYINDMPSTPNTELAVYADDTAVMAQSARPAQLCLYLQRALTALEQWYSRWRMKVNASKSQATQIARRRTKPPQQLVINGTPIPWKKTAKYLGVTLDSTLTWRPHIEELRSKAICRLGMLGHLLNRRSVLSRRNALLLYKTLIRPIMTYAAPAWCYAAPTNIARLAVVQHKILRIIAHAPRRMPNRRIHAQLQMPPLQQYLKDLSTAFYTSLSADHPNSLIANLGRYDINDDDYYARPRHALT